MGDYTIVIEGTGAHHNYPSIEGDANVIALKFAEMLEQHGHKIHAVVMTSGKRDILVGG